MSIDWHCHWLPPTLAEALRARVTAPRIVAGPKGERLEVYRESLPVGLDLTEIDRRLAFMDRHGVETQVLSLPGLFGIDSLPVDEAAPLVRAFNDALAETIAGQPGRFAGFATIPLADATAAVSELQRVLARPGFVGVILPVDGFQTLAHTQALAPILETADAMAAHIFIHPGPMPGAGVGTVERDNDNMRHIVLDVQARLSSVVVTLAMTNFLETYPRLTVQVANLGGAIPFLVERMDHVSSVRTPEAPLPSSRFGRLYVDTASFGPRAIALAAEVFGRERVLLGTDCPIFETGRTLEALRSSGLPATDITAILKGNGATLLRPWPKARSG
ncbi:MAG: amidohydrolase family protein [Alphaproteobacteria bacterium]|nr:amidohydrolase family protein [Alphaproteobacteria bacterium]